MKEFQLLSTKELDPGVQDRLVQAGFKITIKTFISIKPVTGVEIKNKIKHALQFSSNLIFTSSNAVEIFKNFFNERELITTQQSFNIFCISGKTLQAIKSLEKNEIKEVVYADNAALLAEKILIKDVADCSFFSGNIRKDELPVKLKEAGIKMNEVVLYNTVENANEIAGNFDGVLFFSPSAVKSFFSVNKLKSACVCFAIGNTTATAISDHCKNIIVAKQPAQSAMAENIIEHFFNNSK